MSKKSTDPTGLYRTLTLQDSGEQGARVGEEVRCPTVRCATVGYFWETPAGQE